MLLAETAIFYVLLGAAVAVAVYVRGAEGRRGARTGRRIANGWRVFVLAAVCADAACACKF
jgi:hypothetical protein